MGQVALLSPQDRAWVVLQCYRSARDVPPAFFRRVEPAELAALDPQAAIERVADAALASDDDPGALLAGLDGWIRRLPVEGLDNRDAAIAIRPQFARLLVRLALRGWIDGIDLSRAGSSYAIIDAAAPGEAWPAFVRIVDRLVQTGHCGWVESFVEHNDGHASEEEGAPGSAQAIELRAALLRHGRVNEAVAHVAKSLPGPSASPTPCRGPAAAYQQ